MIRRDLVDAINIHKQKEDDEWRDEILTSLEPASITEAQNHEFEMFADDECEDGPALYENNDDIVLELPIKRMCLLSSKRKICSVRECQNNHFWA